MVHKSAAIYIFTILIGTIACAQNSNNVVIGKEVNGAYVFSRDTLELKSFFSAFVGDSIVSKNPKFDKISIEKGYYKGEMPKDFQTEYYYLLCRNFEYDLKLAIALNKQNESFILFYQQDEMEKEDRFLWKRFLICYGSDDNCFPQLFYRDGRKRWGSAPIVKEYCDPNDPCKTLSSIFTF